MRDPGNEVGPWCQCDGLHDRILHFKRIEIHQDTFITTIHFHLYITCTSFETLSSSNNCCDSIATNAIIYFTHQSLCILQSRLITDYHKQMKEYINRRINIEKLSIYIVH